MTIQVALYAGLTRYLPRGAQNRKATFRVPDGATVLEVMRQLGVPDDVPCIPVVDGVRARAETVLRDGETLSLFPPLTGGAAAPDRAV